MSTYSPDLRIELISTGDQAGTWGTTTNTNLGTLVEDAISGYTTVSVTSANQAFTALNGAADEARNAMIRLTTTTTANFAVYAPPNSKQYIIWNNSGYTATIYNSTVLGNTTAAGTGVAIADGDSVVVFTNGTNFYTVKTNNVTGTVAVANGGTGQTSYTDGQLLIGNSTGNTLTKATLTAGSGITITNGNGSIQIAAAGSGVTSVGATAPVASSGGTTPTISLNNNYGDTLNPYASKTANYFLAAPNGTTGAPTFRAIVAADIPTLNQNTTGSAASVVTANFSIVESGGKLLFKYGGTTIASMTSAGVFTALSSVSGSGTP